MKIRTLLIVFASLVLARATFAQSGMDTAHIPENLKFTVKTVQGDEVNFRDYLGKGPILIDFWALWCEPCKQEMKAFKTIQEKFKSEGVNLIAINTDQVRNIAKVRAYITTQGFGFPVLLDPDGSIARDIFSMESLPFSLVLMPDGTIYKKHIGYTAGDEKVAEQEVMELIEKLKKKS